jgi:UDP-glucuronate 4-epimerase
MVIVVTGAAGFIGYHVSRTLLARGEQILGIDNLNSYYDPKLKQARIDALAQEFGKAFAFHRADFAEADELSAVVEGVEFEKIVHLGAQVGVRYGLKNPLSYARSNIVGHLNMLELARERELKHLVYASSSSVYGANTSLPFRVEDRTDRPISLYAATKKADELISESYSSLFRLPMTGLRFFTVYGPWGRPDMAMWLFTKAILAGEPLDLFNGGAMRRDFTYIDDVVAGTVACLDSPPVDDGQEKPGGSVSPHAVYNIGNNRSEDLMELIAILEQNLRRTAATNKLPMQPGDVVDTFADISAIQKDHGFEPKISIREGVPRFIEWYKSYHGIA